jgi:hypothetical protein
MAIRSSTLWWGPLISGTLLLVAISTIPLAPQQALVITPKPAEAGSPLSELTMLCTDDQSCWVEGRSGVVLQRSQADGGALFLGLQEHDELLQGTIGSRTHRTRTLTALLRLSQRLDDAEHAELKVLRGGEPLTLTIDRPPKPPRRQRIGCKL